MVPGNMEKEIFYNRGEWAVPGPEKLIIPYRVKSAILVSS